MTNIAEFKQKLSETEQLLSSTAQRTENIYQVPEGWIIEYPEFAKLADDQIHTIWPWDEHKVSNDTDDLRTNATEAEREAICNNLLLFTHYELRAGEDYWMGRIQRRFKRPELQRMSSMFGAVELNSHAPFYNEANEVLYLSNREFYSKWRLDPDLVDRMDYIDAITRSKDDLISVAGFTFIEGAVLYSSFAFFKHFQSQECGKDLIKNFCRGINLSVGDENSHAIGGALLFRQLLKERNLSEDEKKALAEIIYYAARMAFEHECKIIEKTFSFGEIKGITAQNLIDFVKHRIDLCLNNLGLKGLFEEDKLDGFIESWFYKNINALQFHDFFTGGGSEYDANWTKELFGDVFDPNSEFFDPIVEEVALEGFDKSELKHYLVLGKQDCPFCDDVKDILTSENIPFVYKQLGKDITRDEFLQFMEVNAGVIPKTVPQVFRLMKDGSQLYIGGGEKFVDDLFSSEKALEVK